MFLLTALVIMQHPATYCGEGLATSTTGTEQAVILALAALISLPVSGSVFVAFGLRGTN